MTMKGSMPSNQLVVLAAFANLKAAQLRRLDGLARELLQLITMALFFFFLVSFC